MILKPINDINLFAEKAEPHLGVFGSLKWLSVYKNLSLIGIYADEQKLVGGFYFLKTKKYGFAFLKLPPYTPHCGLFFNSDSKNRSSVNSFSKEVLTEVCSYISSQQGALTVLAFPSSIVDLQPFIWEKYKVVPNYTYRIDLTRSVEDIRSDFDPKNRNAINKAVKDGATVSVNAADKKTLFDFFSHHLSGAGANVYKSELKNIFYTFSDAYNSFSMVAKKEDKLLGIVFCIFDKKTCYYLLGGVDKEAGMQGINNLLVQKSIERAKELGCTIFDFEGSMLKGVEKFFRSFGPELVPYYTVNKASLPIEMLLKFKKRELF